MARSVTCLSPVEQLFSYWSQTHKQEAAEDSYLIAQILQS